MVDRWKIWRMNMVKLIYTDEMKQQDKLWKVDKEDIILMEKLKKDIMKEAGIKFVRDFERFSCFGLIGNLEYRINCLEH